MQVMLSEGFFFISLIEAGNVYIETKTRTNGHFLTTPLLILSVIITFI